jgi:hypothetical protein
MATTTTYGFEIPDDTDLVKDGALAMRDLGQDVDTTLATALNSKNNAGLVLIKRQTVGSGVTSVTLTSVFSSTYDNYRVVIGGIDGSSIGLNIRCQLGSTPNEHYGSLFYDAYDGSDTNYTRSANAANFNVGLGGNGDDTSSSFDLYSPNLAKRTTMSGTYDGFKYSGWFGGAVNTTTQYTSFNILVTGGATLTGGTISVYGYGMS